MACGDGHRWRSGFPNFTTLVMKKVTYLFVVSSAIFLLGRLIVLTDIDQPWWMKNYLNDLLCMPIILSICLKVVQVLKKDSSIRISLFSVLSLATFYSLYFEIILPLFMERYTADVYDVNLYFTGALLFFFLQEPKSKSRRISKIKKGRQNRQP